ncbi:hypothetical protein ACJMK2_025110 [Sinanodonta woodiana]|uniref:Beta-1,4-galactosyltransferase n=1 Tax=Sinanodonta woodiana TaxID=1069815 RepID=A0ABD3XHF5_SINWO
MLNITICSVLYTSHSLNYCQYCIQVELTVASRISTTFPFLNSIEDIHSFQYLASLGKLNITENLTLEEVTDPESLKRVIFGGRYRPPDCKARDHVAIIIPYRDRKHDLDVQVRLLHQVLQRQQCDYMIFVVEMALPTAFNKGLINNAGFTTAMMINNFSCVIFQDVDAFMMDDRNLYRCGPDPRHYLAYSTKYGDKGLPNPELYGGVIGFTPGQFTKVNGFSNLYFGWGEEDNDLYIRVQHAGLQYVRSSKDVGGYLGFKHDHDATNPEGSAYSLIRNAQARATVEGVGTIRFKRYAVEYRDLYTWILIGVEQADITQTLAIAIAIAICNCNRLDYAPNNQHTTWHQIWNIHISGRS